MLKRDGKYYLTYAAAGTENRTYAMGCAVGKSPLGPFVPQKNNPVLRTTTGLVTGTAHGCVVEGPHKSLWAFYTVRAGVVHGFERRLGMDPAYIGEDGELHVNGASSLPQRLPTASKGAEPTGWLPLNAGPRTVGSSDAPNLSGRLAVDDDLRTWWQPAADDKTPTLTSNLTTPGAVVRAVRVVWRDVGLNTKKGAKAGAFRYKVEVRTAADTWTTVIDRSQSTDDLLIDYRECPATPGTAARLVIVGAPPGITPGVAEFTVFGEVRNQPGPAIKDVYKNHFLIGMAGDIPGNYSDEELGLVKGHFNVVTPENCMKPGPVHPAEDKWSFERPDALVKWCGENKLAVHGHTLVWHAQTNPWFFAGGDKEVVTKRHEGPHHHAGRALQGEDPGLGRRQRGDQRRRQRRDGQDGEPPQLPVAADRGAGVPHARVQVRPRGRPGRQAVLQRLQHRGRPQARELDGAAPAADQGRRADPRRGDPGPLEHGQRPLRGHRQGDRGLRLAGAEGQHHGAGRDDPRGRGGPVRPRRRPKGPVTPPSPEDLKAQADAYAKLFAIFIKHKDVIERVTFWGLSDRRTWRFGQHPLIFDADNQPKPAYAAIIDALLRPNPDLGPPR